MVVYPGPTSPNVLSLASAVIDVKRDFQAAGDGITDDSLPIANALAAASNRYNAARVYFPPGLYLTGPQPLQSRVHIEGSGIEASIIKLKNGSNADLFYGVVNGYAGGVMCNVGAAEGTGVGGGIYNWSLQDITLDGNKAGQTGGPSYCVRQYGFGFIIHNVRMRNGYSGGLLTDWNGGGDSGSDSMEAQITNLKIHDCGGIGLEWGGPHDSHLINVIVYNSGTTNFHIGPNATAMLLVNCHGFSPGAGVSACSFLIEGGYGQYSNCVSEGSDTCNTAILAGDIDWVGCHIFGIVGNAALQKCGLQLGQQAGQTPFAGSVNQVAGVTTAWVASGCFIDGNFNMNNLWAINFANETNNVVRATCYNTGGNVIVGTPNAQTSYEIYMNGLTPDGTIGKGGGAYHAIKANKASTWSDRTQDVLNLNTNAKRLELPNGTELKAYSDAYSTILYDIVSTLATFNIPLKIAKSANQALQITDGINDVANINTAAKKFEFPNGAILKFYSDAYITATLETLADAYGTLKFAGDAAATIARRADGILAFGGGVAYAQGAVQVIATSDTVTMGNIGIARLNPAGAVTGIKLAAGVFGGQVLTIINESAFTVTFDIAANSFVADGVSDIIAATTAARYVWDNSVNLWFRCV